MPGGFYGNNGLWNTEILCYIKLLLLQGHASIYMAVTDLSISVIKESRTTPTLSSEHPQMLTPINTYNIQQ